MCIVLYFEIILDGKTIEKLMSVCMSVSLIKLCGIKFKI